MAAFEIALAGNPNSGKTSVFNLLTGANQYVGNWPGVTVERKEGSAKSNKEIKIQDLPGIYSMSPYSPEEVIARDYLLSKKATAILNVVDATNLTRNLYLTTQLLETGVPVVIGLNMMDVVAKSGLQINLEKLAYALDTPVVGMSALKKQGVEEALQTATHLKTKVEMNYPTYDKRLESALSEISDILGQTVPEQQSRWFAIKLFERDVRVHEEINLSSIQKTEIEEVIKITEKVFEEDSEAILINERYAFVEGAVQLATTDTDDFKASISDKVDSIVTNRWLALPIFAFVMWLVYYISIQTIGVMGTDWVNEVLFGEIVPEAAESWMVSANVAGWMQDLVLSGIIAGVGAVLGFVPQLLVLFFCLAILEDCGYMSRIAFVMDRIFRKFGMSGKSFIPMLVATGCGVPGVMATRTIENEKDRRMTIILTTFMPCSAKLPIVALIAGAFFPHSSWVAPSAYFIGMAAIVLSGIALKKTKLFAGDPAPFIMELPPYHLPQLKNVLWQTFDRGMAFIKKAGTIIFVSSIIIWFLSSYSFSFKAVDGDESILANLGRVVAPIFAPLGWGNWQSTVATITGLVAKENVLNTFGILFHNVEEVSENGVEVWGDLQAVITPVAAYSFLVFNLLCAPCFAAIGAIHREMVQVKWTWIAIAYQCGLAYAASLVIYQFGHIIFEGGSFNAMTVVAGAVLLTMVYFLFKKGKPQNDGTISLDANDLIGKGANGWQP
ncbi:ferrous iron transport protein B [Enterococcus sp. PF1-24]|uniref:ferrous iron transport protein B n=1 Tax=unclassified Enterococcus TaxID=2608891 RepID=UPI00247625C1|nr:MULTISPECIES: ferrous iron transport protein B [unclassified Enterococcus]MDH6363563.1 ferrous iron transport protein B [Enterococcus sp. PFB1-1]MDH6400798.1 ferrous iron transport protein B [Enterococcus sp. PF1-24]